jgi:predicted Zn-dependent peptidase
LTAVFPEWFKTLVLYGLPPVFFETYTRRIQAVSAEDILATAQHYFTGLSTVSAGGSGHHK